MSTGKTGLDAPSTAAATTLVALLWAAAAPSWAAEGWLVEREVTADLFRAPVAVGLERRCPERLRRPSSGARILLRFDGERARRDEPVLSFIVRLDSNRAFVLHHGQSTYSELSLPLEVALFESGPRAFLGAEADEFLSFRLEGEVGEESGRIGELATLVRSATVGNKLGTRIDVAVHFLADAEATAAARAVEGFSQAIWRGGEEWLSLLGGEGGVPLTVEEALHQPSVKVRYAEVFQSLQRVEIDPALFAPPPDYSRVELRPECLSLY